MQATLGIIDGGDKDSGAKNGNQGARNALNNGQSLNKQNDVKMMDQSTELQKLKDENRLLKRTLLDRFDDKFQD